MSAPKTARESSAAGGSGNSWQVARHWVGEFADSLSENHTPGSPLTKLGQFLPQGFGAVSIDSGWTRSQEGKRLPNDEPSAAVAALSDSVAGAARL